MRLFERERESATASSFVLSALPHFFFFFFYLPMQFLQIVSLPDVRPDRRRLGLGQGGARGLGRRGEGGGQGRLEGGLWCAACGGGGRLRRTTSPAPARQDGRDGGVSPQGGQLGFEA